MDYRIEEEENNLCDRCSCIELPAADSKEDWSLETSMHDVMASGSTGCHLCKMLTTLLDLDSKPLDQGYYIRLLYMSSWPMHLSCYLLSTTGPIAAGNFDMDRGLGTITTPSFSHTVSPELLKLVNRWLSKCIQSHNVPAAIDASLPTRVLDLAGAKSGFVRLWVPSPYSRARYAALSYCWGGGKTFTTTSSTLVRNLGGFPISDLPRTLRDAVQITAALGIQYLWIDALCILQGQDEASRNDWIEESSKMESVYGGAHITIVVATARHSDEGILLPRSCALASAGNACSSKNQVMVRWENQSLDDFRLDPIQRRAWTLQESLLSPRLLICRQTAVILQCDAGMLLESDQGRLGQIDEIYQYRLPKDKWDWDVVVENFCKRNLTYGSDKLPAIAGLARKYHKLTSDKYLAGLWESDLLKQLVWFSHKRYGEGPCKKSAKYRAPSWSWDSVDGPNSPCRWRIVGYDLHAS